APMPPSASRTPPASPSRSSRRSPIRSASRSCRADGWSSASSPGSTATEGSQRTSRPPSPLPKPSSTPPPSCCSHDAWHGQNEFRVGLLADRGNFGHRGHVSLDAHLHLASGRHTLGFNTGTSYVERPNAEERETKAIRMTV